MPLDNIQTTKPGFKEVPVPDTPITDALTGVLKGDYDDKAIRTERAISEIC